MPEENLKNLRDIPEDVKKEMNFSGVETIAAAIPLVIPGLTTKPGLTGHQATAAYV
jgi:ATP-dependent Lon protease